MDRYIAQQSPFAGWTVFDTQAEWETAIQVFPDYKPGGDDKKFAKFKADEWNRQARVHGTTQCTTTQ